MGAIGRLRRNLDLDLIARIANGSVFQPEPAKRVKGARTSDTYRANKPCDMEQRRRWRLALEPMRYIVGRSKYMPHQGTRECARRASV